MLQIAPTYVEQTPQGGYRVTGTRVSLDSVVHAYWEGKLPEVIVAEFPVLSLAQVYGALAYYLENRPAIDAYLAEQDARWEDLRRESELRNAELLGRIRGAAAAAKPQRGNS